MRYEEEGGREGGREGGAGRAECGREVVMCSETHSTNLSLAMSVMSIHDTYAPTTPMAMQARPGFTSS